MTAYAIEHVYDPEKGDGFHCTACDTYAYGDSITFAEKFELRMFDDEFFGMCKTCSLSDYSKVQNTPQFSEYMRSIEHQEENERTLEEYRSRHPNLYPPEDSEEPSSK